MLYLSCFSKGVLNFLMFARIPGNFSCLALSFPSTLSLIRQNIRKPNGFIMFSGDRERVHLEQMGEYVRFSGQYESFIVPSFV